MYRIFSDLGLIYDPTRSDENYIISAGKFDNQVNAAGSASFTIPKTAVAATYQFRRLVTRIWFTQDEPNDNGDYKVVWYGRVSDIRRDFNLNKVVTCEGAMAFLNDVVVMPFIYWNRDLNQSIYNPDIMDYEVWHYEAAVADFGGAPGLVREIDGTHRKLQAKKVSPAEHINKLNHIYNTFCDQNRTLNIIPNEFDMESYATIEGVNSFTSIFSDITNTVQKDTELMLYPTYSMENGNIACTIHVQKMPYGRCEDQEICFALNLLDLEEYMTSSDLYDRIVAVGSGDLSTYTEVYRVFDPVTRTSYVFSSQDYYLDVEDREWHINGRGCYGGIDKIITFNNVTDVDELKRAAQNVAALGGGMEDIQFSIGAVDLHYLNVNVSRIKFGYEYHVISEPHNCNDWYVCMKEDIDILNPSASKYDFSKPQKISPETFVDKFYDEVTGIYRAINQRLQEDKPYGCVLLRSNDLKLVMTMPDPPTTGGVT